LLEDILRQLALDGVECGVNLIPRDSLLCLNSCLDSRPRCACRACTGGYVGRGSIDCLGGRSPGILYRCLGAGGPCPAEADLTGKLAPARASPLQGLPIEEAGFPYVVQELDLRNENARKGARIQEPVQV
jgi:hypothetical protein